jgi:hypothetical protein
MVLAPHPKSFSGKYSWGGKSVSKWSLPSFLNQCRFFQTTQKYVNAKIWTGKSGG